LLVPGKKEETTKRKIVGEKKMEKRRGEKSRVGITQQNTGGGGMRVTA